MREVGGRVPQRSGNIAQTDGRGIMPFDIIHDVPHDLRIRGIQPATVLCAFSSRRRLTVGHCNSCLTRPTLPRIVRGNRLRARIRRARYKSRYREPARDYGDSGTAGRDTLDSLQMNAVRCRDRNGSRSIRPTMSPVEHGRGSHRIPIFERSIALFASR